MGGRWAGVSHLMSPPRGPLSTQWPCLLTLCIHRGTQNKSRDSHLPQIETPALFCSGTRDTFATPEELSAAASTVSLATVHPLEGADHGFAVLKSSGRTKEDVWSEATGFLLSWLETEVLDRGDAAHLR